MSSHWCKDEGNQQGENQRGKAIGQPRRMRTGYSRLLWQSGRIFDIDRGSHLRLVLGAPGNGELDAPAVAGLKADDGQGVLPAIVG
jgi:hypothetical protein